MNPNRFTAGAELLAARSSWKELHRITSWLVLAMFLDTPFNRPVAQDCPFLTILGRVTCTSDTPARRALSPAFIVDSFSRVPVGLAVPDSRARSPMCRTERFSCGVCAFATIPTALCVTHHSASSFQGGCGWPTRSARSRYPMPWMRDCPQCHRMLIKRHLSEAIKCICGWIWS